LSRLIVSVLGRVHGSSRLARRQHRRWLGWSSTPDQPEHDERHRPADVVNISLRSAAATETDKGETDEV